MKTIEYIQDEYLKLCLNIYSMRDAGEITRVTECEVCQ